MAKKGKLKRRPNPSKKKSDEASRDGQIHLEQSKAKSIGKSSIQSKRKGENKEANEIQTLGDSAGSGKLNETFEVEFEFYDPEEDDFHSVRDLLCSGTLGALDLDFSSLANSIVDQVNIGTMVKSGADEARQTPQTPEEEDDVTLCGMLTILNLRQFAEEVWCKNLVTLLQGKLKLDKQMLQYIQASGKDQVGLIISERFVNLPLEVIPAMHNVILEDISWSCSTEYCPPEEPKQVKTVNIFWQFDKTSCASCVCVFCFVSFIKYVVGIL